MCGDCWAPSSVKQLYHHKGDRELFLAFGLLHDMPRRDRIARGNGGGKRKLLPQVLDTVHEIFNGCPRIAVICGEDRFYWSSSGSSIATVA